MASEITLHAPSPETTSNHESKYYYSHFPFKTAFVAVFLLLLPLFQCEILNQFVSATSWELLQLIFVGIAVSYGLFSKKNYEIEKDHGIKLDNTQSYVSKLLQVSSVFDDESDNDDENKVRTWNAQYYRGEPVVVMANENHNFKEEGVTLGISRKSLLLPVRSLRQHVVPQPNETDLVDESSDDNLMKKLSSNSSSKRLSSSNLCIPKYREFEDKDSQTEETEEKTKDYIVLPSPIPWRSRSGRRVMEKNVDYPECISSSQESNPSSFSVESQAIKSEDLSRKKKLSSPPASPPFPEKYLKKSNSSGMSSSFSSEKEVRRRARSMPTEELTDSEIEELFGKMHSRSVSRGRMANDDLMKSFRMFRSSEPVTEAETRSFNRDTKSVEEKGYVEANNELLEKILMETSDDEDSSAETEGDDFVGSLSNEKDVNSNNGSDPGPDVDKKADEFIAKFREQIRLQRLNSFRKSNADFGLKT